jgi:hypothetical protein
VHRQRNQRNQRRERRRSVGNLAEQAGGESPRRSVARIARDLNDRQVPCRRNNLPVMSRARRCASTSRWTIGPVLVAGGVQVSTQDLIDRGLDRVKL